MKKHFALPILFGVIAAALALADCGDAFALSGAEIAKKVYERPDGSDRHQTVTLTLINQSGSKRVRKLETKSIDKGRDQKSISLFLSPADVKNTMYLAWTYGSAGRDDDRWLYLPSLKNVRRISGASKNDYFMGTDFTYDELSKRSDEKDVHELLGEETYQGRACWKLKSVPKDKSEKYTHKIHLVDKESLIPLREEYYDKDGLVKTLLVLEQKKVGGFWTIMHSIMDNVSRKHKTEFQVDSVEYDTGISESIFQVNTLQRGRL